MENIDWGKRLKSGLMVFGSVLLSALIAVVPTVEFANFVTWTQDLLTGLGVSGVIVSLGTAVISQIWMQLVNNAKAHKGFAGARVDTY